MKMAIGADVENGICARVTYNFPYGILSWDVEDLWTTKLILRLIVASELTVPL